MWWVGHVFANCYNFRVAKENIPKKMTFEQSSEGAQETRYIDIWRRYAPGKGNSWCKDPEMGTCVMYLKNNGEDSGWSPGQETADPRRPVRDLVPEGPSTSCSRSEGLSGGGYPFMSTVSAWETLFLSPRTLSRVGARKDSCFLSHRLVECWLQTIGTPCPWLRQWGERRAYTQGSLCHQHPQPWPRPRTPPSWVSEGEWDFLLLTKFSTFSWYSLGRLYISKNVSVSSRLSNLLACNSS